jgi:protein involved in polysaccharide export with SLBB domain
MNAHQRNSTERQSQKSLFYGSIGMTSQRGIFGSLAALVLLTACKTPTTETVEARPSHWAYQPEQRVDIVPSIPAMVDAKAEPTAKMPNESWILGTPRDLTQPLSSQTKKSPQTNPNQSMSSGTVQDGERSITVNLNTSYPTDTLTNSAPVDSMIVDRSRLETLYGGDFEKKADRDLEQFGYDVFARPVVDLETVGAVPFSYKLGTGDEVIITLSGSLDEFHRLEVDREGAIHFPKFGPLTVKGVTYGELAERIENFLLESRHGFELKVSLGRLRTIQVRVVGRVAEPGWVRIPALGSPLAALHIAGGPLKDGSLRQIEIQRLTSEGSESHFVDLYSFLRGITAAEESPMLEDGDLIRVPAIGSTIGIAGFVQQPGIYELLQPETTVGEALDLAGGLTPFSFTPLAHLERTVDGRGRQKEDVELSAEGRLKVMGDGELLLVEAVEDDRQPVVRIEGEVARPGDYAYNDQMTLGALIRRADGLTVDAYLPQVIISRQVGVEAAVETIPGRKAEASSRRIMVVNLASAMSGDPKHDIDIMPLDLVRVRSKAEAHQRAEVEIIGSVQHPGRYELTAGMRVSELIAVAGNPKAEVYYDEAELIRRVFDEDARLLDVQRYRFDLQAALNPRNALNNSLNPVLTNGDRLVVRALQEAHIRASIDGRVRFPGEYVFAAGATITDLIAAAGGILPDADLRAANFSRVSTRQLQQQRLDHLKERSLRLNEDAFTRIVQTGHANEGLAGRLSLEQGQDRLGRMRANETDGRIVIPFTDPNFPYSSYNLPLENGDSLKIPRFHATVSVAGNVFRPVSLVAGESITVDHALEQAGGLTETADEDLLYVVRADGRVDSVAQKPARLTRKTELFPGDVLLVPAKPIERTFSAKLTDTLILARQMAEIALLSSQIGNEIDTTLVSSFVQDTDNTDPVVLKD